VVLAFHSGPRGDAEECRIWLCSSPEEEEAVVDQIGPIEPGLIQLFQSKVARLRDVDKPCSLRKDELRPEWLLQFPSSADVVAMSVHDYRRLGAVRQTSAYWLDANASTHYFDRSKPRPYCQDLVKGSLR